MKYCILNGANGGIHRLFQFSLQTFPNLAIQKVDRDFSLDCRRGRAQNIGGTENEVQRENIPAD